MTLYQKYLEQIKDSKIELDILRQQTKFFNDFFVANQSFVDGKITNTQLLEEIALLQDRIIAQKETIHLLY